MAKKEEGMDLTRVPFDEMLQEMKRRYETEITEIQKLEEELTKKKKAISGVKEMLLKAGLIEAPVRQETGVRGRVPKDEKLHN